MCDKCHSDPLRTLVGLFRCTFVIIVKGEHFSMMHKPLHLFQFVFVCRQHWKEDGVKMMVCEIQLHLEVGVLVHMIGRYVTLSHCRRRFHSPTRPCTLITCACETSLLNREGHSEIE